MSDWPLISLVTPSFNQAPFIEATLQSVLSQGYPRLEYFVMDGGSTDGSVDVIRRYASQLTGWVSEPDAGQTDAIETGFARCSGDILNWINSDDLLRPGALHGVARAWAACAGFDLLAGRSRDFTSDPEQPTGWFSPAGYGHPDCLRFWDGRFRYHQPCTFFSRSAYERAGRLDRSLHYVMDYDFYCRVLALPGVRVAVVEDEFSAFRLHPDAKTSRAKAGFVKEQRAVAMRNWPRDWGRTERRAMNRYSAECSIHQAAEAARASDWKRAGAGLLSSLRFAPLHAVGYALGRAAGGGAHP